MVAGWEQARIVQTKSPLKQKKSASPVMSYYRNVCTCYRNRAYWLKNIVIGLRFLVVYTSVMIGFLATGGGVVTLCH